MNGHDSTDRRPDRSSPRTVFEWVDSRHQFLVETCDRLLDMPERASASRCLYLAHQVQKLCKSHPVALLAVLQLNRKASYQQIKELFAAVLCELLARELDMAPSQRLFLICAALTQDLGMLALQEQILDRQPGPLTDAQKRQVLKHPQKSIQILERAHIKERLWLKTLEQHHEQPDGEGYPLGLKGSSIIQAARVLRVADSYVAMVRPRGDRPAITPVEAIREIFLHRGMRYDAVVARTLTSVLGMYPPGTWVRLYNGELGVVSGIGSSHPFPVVSSVLSADGEHLAKALARDTHDKQFTIVEVVRAPFHFSLTSVLNEIWPDITEKPDSDSAR